MALARRIRSRVSDVVDKSQHQSATAADLNGWRITQMSIGYLSQDVVIGKPLTVNVGIVNMTEFDLKLVFGDSRRIKIIVSDATGNALYTSPGGSGPGGTEIINSMNGASWLEKIVLDTTKFKPGNSYLISGGLSGDFPGSASVLLEIP